ncbi:ubiquinol-cytochrome C chaperone [Sphingomonas spermidinifaciens]|uniref:Ubiquinol-cytochrome C chaperone n=1 Tax=Sphingomonas spermidinifaciens TaxID=1141889 RepID=A0A2A4B8M2_9SPHN|nr:ubiquinol-cytochrome C chaperone family protein [Sphingomonas spermidinifaciens]PCD04014.1 ubiquinol-cytochrome C chaperone [Sphingomonas spermidinifaciens]
MGLLQRLFGSAPPREGEPLYAAIVARARAAHWYVEGGVPDTIDGRFDMVAAVLAMVLLRLETEGERAASLSASLAECFIEDMDVQLRQQGVGDIMVGKHIGKMMGMLGGRLGAYRDGLAAGDLGPALVRNVWRGEPPEPQALAHVRDHLVGFRGDLDGMGVDRLREGVLP